MLDHFFYTVRQMSRDKWRYVLETYFILPLTCTNQSNLAKAALTSPTWQQWVFPLMIINPPKDIAASTGTRVVAEPADKVAETPQFSVSASEFTNLQTKEQQSRNSTTSSDYPRETQCCD